MSTKGKLKGRMATRKDIKNAVAALTPRETTRLKRYADSIYLAYGGMRPSAETTDDFIQDAFLKLLTGDRKWYPSQKPFIFHLMNIVGSLISHWSESQEIRLRIDNRLLRSPGDDDPEGDWLDDVESSESGPEGQIMWKQQYAKLMDKLIDTLRPIESAVDVLMLKRIGFSSTEIIQKIGLSQNEFENIDKQIRRKTEIIQLIESREMDRWQRNNLPRISSFMTESPHSYVLSLDELLALASIFPPNEELHDQLIGLFNAVLVKKEKANHDGKS